MSELQNWFVLYTETGIGVQVFQCLAEGAEHADDQCMYIHPKATILWSGTGSAEEVLDEWADRGSLSKGGE